VITTGSPPVPADGEIAVTTGCIPPSGPVGTFGTFCEEGDASAPVGTFGTFCDVAVHAKPPQTNASAEIPVNTVREAGEPLACLRPRPAVIDTTRPWHDLLMIDSRREGISRP
jgi:hypothetical protein